MKAKGKASIMTVSPVILPEAPVLCWGSVPKRGFGRCDGGHKVVDCNCQGCAGAECRRGISLSNQRRRGAVMLSATISPYTMVGRRAPYAIGLLAAVLLVMAGMADAASARSSGSQGSNLANTGKNKISPPSPPAGPVPIPYPNVGKRDAATGQASGKRSHKPIKAR